MTLITSPLRYSGGKSRVAKHLHALMPTDIQEYRELFAGGASMFFYVKQIPNNIQSFILADAYHELINFWQHASDDLKNKHMIAVLRDLYKDILKTPELGRRTFHLYKKMPVLNDIESAIRFFYLNRASFSGTTKSGGYSSDACARRFTLSAISRLAECKTAFTNNVQIIASDFEPGIEAHGTNVFMYLDPPYFNAQKLYGTNGGLHTGFDHERLADSLRRTNHRFLLSYNDTPAIRSFYSWANIDTMRIQYGMTNAGQSSEIPACDELVIRNYCKRGIESWPII